MLKGRNKAILVGLGIVAPIFSAIGGCSGPPQAVDIYLDAVMLRELGKNELAIERLKQVVEADSGFVLAYSELGRAYRDMGELDPAVAAFEKATALDAWSFADHMDLAEIYQQQGRFAEAAPVYGRAAELDPESCAAQAGAAECYLKAGQTVRALVHAELARQMDERPREVALLLAGIYEAQGDYEQAIEVLVSALQRRPEDATALRHRAYCLLKLGDTDGAIEGYEKAIGLDAGDWQAHRGLGVAYVVKARQTGDGRFESMGLDHWQQALALAPDQPRGDVLQRLIEEHATTRNPLRGLDY